mmetsp:Transcript_16496/g.25488  ORF Transcript_16496/g.25488 Transcript_16496/m.25488 type:complete len:114 (-) Transcript_16496:9340-9681(-)
MFQEEKVFEYLSSGFYKTITEKKKGKNKTLKNKSVSPMRSARFGGETDQAKRDKSVEQSSLRLKDNEPEIEITPYLLKRRKARKKKVKPIEHPSDDVSSEMTLAICLILANMS